MTRAFSALSLSIATLLISFSANAYVRPAGAFMAQQCGAQTLAATQADAAIVSTCLGAIVGSPEQAVAFNMADGTLRTFRVTSRTDLLMSFSSGNRLSVFQLVGADGETASLKAIINHDGSFKSVSGVYRTNSFLVPELKQMLTLM